MAEAEGTKKIVYILFLLGFVVLLVNQILIFSVTGFSVAASSGSLNVGSLNSGASIADIKATILPTEADRVRPYKVNGKEIILSLDTTDYLVKFDPFSPNGARGNEAPSDLTPEQQEIYKRISYGTAENNFQDAGGGCLYCNAPTGGGGCFKKRTQRALVYLLLKQDWSEEQIRDELFLWNRFFFPGVYVKWYKYYLDNGLDVDEIDESLKFVSSSANSRVSLALESGNLEDVPEQVGGCFR